MTPELDIVIPVYNEGRNIVAVLAALKRAVATPARVLIRSAPEENVRPAPVKITTRVSKSSCRSRHTCCRSS